MRSRGRIGLTELVLWDVVLAGLAAGLVYVDSRWERAAPKPVEQAVKTNQKKRAKRKTVEPAHKSPAAHTGTRRASASDDPPPDPAEAELSDLRAKARVHLPKRPDKALAVYERAPASLRRSVAWQAFWPGERKRLLAGLEATDLLTALRPEVQLAADAGRPRAVQSLLARLPVAGRAALDPEITRAKQAQAAQTKPPKKKGGGLEIKGFSPDAVKLKGVRCVVQGGLGRTVSEAVRDEVDGLLERGERLLGRSLSARLDLRLLAPADEAVKHTAVLRTTRQRNQEPAPAVRARARYLAARWLATQLLRPASGFWRVSFARALAGARDRAGALRAEGQARRRLFLAAKPDGSGTVLLGLARKTRDDSDDPAGTRGWALVHFACFSSDSAALDLKRALLDELGGKPGALAAFLTPTRAVGLERKWVAHVESSR